MPVTDDPRIARAEADVEVARDRLFATIEAISAQLAPRQLIRELWEDAKVKGADLAEEAVDAVKARPVAAGGAVAALALFLAREPLIALAGKVTGFGKKGRDGKKRAARASAAAAPRKARKSKDEVEKTK